MPIIHPTELGQLSLESLPVMSSRYNEDDLFNHVLRGIQARDYGKTLKWAMCYRDYFYGIHTEFPREHVTAEFLEYATAKASDPNTPTNEKFRRINDRFPELALRDARQANGHNPENFDPRALMILAINYTRAVELLLRLELNTDFPTHLENEMSTALLMSIKNINKKPGHAKRELARLTSYLVQLLAQELKISKKEAQKRLIVAKDFANSQDPTTHIVTASQHQNKTLLEIDSPLCEMTEELKQEYNANVRQRSTWYQKMASWEKKLVDHAAELFIKEGRRLPSTQLRGYLPGLRMAYLSSYGHQDDEGQFVVDGENFNAATLLFRSKSKSANKRILDMNVHQLQEHMKGYYNDDNRKVMFISLNAKNIPHKGENKIVSESQLALNEKGHFFANLCLNDFRIITGNVYQAIERQLLNVSELDLLSSIDESIKASTVTIQKYIFENNSKNAAKLQKKSIQGRYQEVMSLLKNNKEAYDQINLHLYPLLRSAIICRRDVKLNMSHLTDPENRNLSIGAHTIIINQRLHAISNMHPFATVANGCQSNKDRGGILLFFVKVFGLSTLFEQEDQHDEISKTLANAGHTQFRAGWQGGTLGAFGIKKSTIGALPRSIHKDARDRLLRSEASLNSKLLEKDPGIHNSQEALINSLTGLRYRIHRTQSKCNFSYSGIFHRIRHALFSSHKISQARVQLLKDTLNKIDLNLSNCENPLTMIRTELNTFIQANKKVARKNGGLFWFVHKEGGTQKFARAMSKCLDTFEKPSLSVKPQRRP